MIFLHHVDFHSPLTLVVFFRQKDAVKKFKKFLLIHRFYLRFFRVSRGAVLIYFVARDAFYKNKLIISIKMNSNKIDGRTWGNTPVLVTR